jgi:ATP-binding cassette, subfamily B, bacterial
MKLPNIEPERIPKLSSKFVGRILIWYQPYRWRILLGGAFILAGIGFTVAQPLVLRNVVDQAAAGSDFNQLARAALLLVMLPVLAALLGVIQQRVLGSISADIHFDLRNHVYGYLQKLPYRMYVHAPPGEFNARLTGDVQHTSQLLTQTFPEGLNNGLRILISLGIMLALEWRLTLAALLVLPLVVWVARKRNYEGHKLMLNNVQLASALGMVVGETTNPGGVLSLRLFDRMQREIERYKEVSAKIRALDLAQNNLNTKNVIWGSMLAALGTAIVYAVGGLLVFGGNFSIGTLIAFVAYLGGLYAALQSLSRLPQGLALALTGYQRIFELLDLETENPGPKRDDLPERARGELRFENVTFRFNDQVPLRETARPWSVRLMGASGQAPKAEQTPKTPSKKSPSASVRGAWSPSSGRAGPAKAPSST